PVRSRGLQSTGPSRVRQTRTRKVSAARHPSGDERMMGRLLSSRPSEMYRRWRAGGEREEWLRCPWLRSALIVWLILTAAVSVRTVVRPSRHTVFPIFAASAKHWWDDEPLYEDDPVLDNFRYPPVFTLFVTPFSVLGLSAGGIVWSWISMA